MNSLSWLLYLAEVSDRLQGVASFIAFMGGMIGAVGAAFLVVMAINGAITKSGATVGVVGYIVFELLFIAIATATPSSSTIYMIAASEAGETIVTSPEAKEMLGDLKQIIRQRIKKELKVQD